MKKIYSNLKYNKDNGEFLTCLHILNNISHTFVAVNIYVG